MEAGTISLMRSSAFVTCLCAAVTGCIADDDVDPCGLNEAGTICEVAGTASRGFNGDGLAASETAFYLPSQARRGPDGLLYIMDFNNMRLRRVEADGTVATVAGDGNHLGATVGRLAYDSSLESPIDFDFLPDGRVVFVSAHDPRVLMIDTDGTLQLVAGSWQPAVPGWEGDGGPADQARFQQLEAIAVGADGAIYVSDREAHRVRVIKNGTINTLAGTGRAAYFGDGGPASTAALNGPSGLAVDAAGNVYVSDTVNCAVRKISTDGTITTIAGLGQHGFGGDEGPATKAALANPEGIAVSADGTIYLADRMNNRIRQVAADGTITTIAGTGEKGYAGDGGLAIDAQLGNISRVQLDTDGGLLISDQTNSMIRKLHLAP